MIPFYTKSATENWKTTLLIHKKYNTFLINKLTEKCELKAVVYAECILSAGASNKVKLKKPYGRAIRFTTLNSKLMNDNKKRWKRN